MNPLLKLLNHTACEQEANDILKEVKVHAAKVRAKLVALQGPTDLNAISNSGTQKLLGLDTPKTNNGLTA